VLEQRLWNEIRHIPYGAGNLDEGPECIGMLFSDSTYGSFDSKRFRQKFPNCLMPIADLQNLLIVIWACGWVPMNMEQLLLRHKNDPKYWYHFAATGYFESVVLDMEGNRIELVA